MLLDLNFPINDLQDQPVPFSDASTAAEAFSNFLVAQQKNVPGISAVRLKKLSKELNQIGKVELTKEEFVSLKNLIHSNETLIILVRAPIEEGFIDSELAHTKKVENEKLASDANSISV